MGLDPVPHCGVRDAAGMTLLDYEDFVTRAMFLDRDDPRAAWQELGETASRASSNSCRASRRSGSKPPAPISRSRWPAEPGSIPTGGATCPRARSSPGRSRIRAQGRLRCGFPVCRDGREIAGINLEIREGKVVVAPVPTSGEDYLHAMLDLDAGARRLGELGLGLNSGIDRFTGSILYDEKIGGTVHLALGQSYPETGGSNQSALHWDLIVDTRTDGRITADGRVVMQNGQWLVG